MLRATARDAVGLSSSVINGPFTIVRENEAPLTPNSPVPFSDALNVPLAVALQWNCADLDGDILSYKVAFGTSTNPPTIAEVARTIYVLSKLSYSTRYFWRIEAWDGNATRTGPVWSFTTESAPPAAPTTIKSARTATGLSITYTGTLQSADSVTGPWADVAGAQSPFNVTAASGAKFYRVKQ